MLSRPSDQPLRSFCVAKRGQSGPVAAKSRRFVPRQTHGHALPLLAHSGARGPVGVSSGAGPPTPSGRKRALYRMRPRRRRSVQGLPHDRVSRAMHKGPSRPPKKICRLTSACSSQRRAPARAPKRASLKSLRGQRPVDVRVALPPLAQSAFTSSLARAWFGRAGVASG